MRIVVIGPYSADSLEEKEGNVKRAAMIGLALMKQGHAVFIPHFTHYIDILPECDFTYEHYMWHSMRWIFVSDAVFVIDHSPGTDEELEYAQLLQKQVFTKLEEVPQFL